LRISSAFFADHQWSAEQTLWTTARAINLVKNKLEHALVYFAGLLNIRHSFLSPGVNFINIFTYGFFVRTLFRQLFLIKFWLWRKTCTKNAHVKLWWNRRLFSLLLYPIVVNSNSISEFWQNLGNLFFTPQILRNEIN